MGATALAATRGFSDRMTDLLDRLDYRLIDTDDEREQVFRLRYEAYLREGAISANLIQKVSDRFDDAENSWTFGLHVDEKIISSIRICIPSARQPVTPAVEAFPDFLEPEVRRGKIIIDSNRFVADAQAARIYSELPYLTVRIGYMASVHFDAHLNTATVRKEHQAFYKRVFGFKPVCEPRPYPTITKPLSLMMLDFRAERPKIISRNPYFRSTFFERRMLFERLDLPRRAAAMLQAKLPSANLNEAPEAVNSGERR
jgi:hypothetical protein